MKLVYPAVFFTFEDGDGYTVEFPDLPGCVTQGDTLEEAIEMATDAASGWILSTIEDEEIIPSPSKHIDINKFDDAAFLNYVLLDMEAYAKQYSNKSIKKTLTIPQWLNTLAEKAGINFSRVLQKALKDTLKLGFDSSYANLSYDIDIALTNIYAEIQRMSLSLEKVKDYQDSETKSNHSMTTYVTLLPYATKLKN